MAKPDWYSNVQPVKTKTVPKPWMCKCIFKPTRSFKSQPAYRVNCPDCFARRPS